MIFVSLTQKLEIPLHLLSCSDLRTVAHMHVLEVQYIIKNPVIEKTKKGGEMSPSRRTEHISFTHKFCRRMTTN